MKRYFLAALCCLGFAMPSFSQNGWLPSAQLGSSSNFCDPSPYQLIFQDNFDGNRLSSPWITFGSWDGMPFVIGNDTIIHDNDLTDDARTDGANPDCIYSDHNIEVSNGTCKLYIKAEPISWRCDTCVKTHYGKISLGEISIPYYDHWVRKSFDRGRFEARIKFPTLRGSWCTFWLWYGTRVNEIDIAEALGGHGDWPYIGTKAHGLVTYSTHAWWPVNDTRIANPYNLPEDEPRNNNYPPSELVALFMGNQS